MATVGFFKRIAVTIFLFGSINALYCQGTQNKDVFHFGIESQSNLDYGSKSFFTQIVLFPERKFSLNYSVGIGTTSENKLFMHFPLGAFFGGYLLVYSNGDNNDFFTALFILSIVVPESVSYNININEKLKVSPYVSFNSTDFYLRSDGEEKLKPTFGVGGKVTYSINKTLGCSFFAGSKLASASGWGVNAGASVAFRY